MGFSRQEHWSGLPFPSPMHESEKWKWSRSVVSNSLRPHGLQPTRLLHPWDFPGNSTGVGWHWLPLLFTVKISSSYGLLPWGITFYFTPFRNWKFSRPVMSDSLQPHGLQTTRLLHPQVFPGKSTGVGCYFLLQRIFPTQGSNLGLPHCRQTLYRLSHQESLILRVITMRNNFVLYTTQRLHTNSPPTRFNLWTCFNWSVKCY